MPELLIEILSEDIPARMQARAADDFKRLVTEKLAAAGLAFTAADAHSTPRRLALVVDGLPERTADVKEEKKGPRVGAPDQAVQGFLKSAGLDSLDQCEQRDTGKGAFWFAVTERKGRDAAEVLAEIIPAAMAELPWPKSMRWATGQVRWVRPLRSIVALFGGKVLAGGFDLGGKVGVAPFGNTTRGHRFLAPEPFAVTSFADYKEKLRAAKVMLDREERKARIRTQAEILAGAEGLALAPDEALLEEVCGLVEWPVVLMGAIDEAFMDVPAEVLITSMRTHQKYFALSDKNGKMARRFVVVANTETQDGGKAVTAGNERVLRARLSDAKFFWDQDRKTKLEERVPALEQITFHAKLGTVRDKVDRMQALAAELAPLVGADVDQARSAALLCKADLVTGVVGEFPELQGIMGRYYALGEGERPEVADAIAEHYKPLGPGDGCPTAPVSVAVALADKIDTLVGFFAIDETPTGSKDPYALRRAALGVIRLVLENGLRIKLRPLFNLAFGSIESKKTILSYPMIDRFLAPKGNWKFSVPGEYVDLASRYDFSGDEYSDFADAEDRGYFERKRAIELYQRDLVASFLTNEILAFFADRLKVVLREQGVRHDLIDAVFALGGEDDLVRLLARVRALQDFVGSDDGANLLTAYKRASNIVRIEEKKDGRAYAEEPDPALLDAPEEKALFSALATATERTRPLLDVEDFTGAMGVLANLRAPVDAFFDRVTVNADDAGLRANRLRLLGQIRATLNAVADFSRIEG